MLTLAIYFAAKAEEMKGPSNKNKGKAKVMEEELKLNVLNINHIVV